MMKRIALLVGLLALVMAVPVSANPPGTTDLGHMLFKFNIIAVPQDNHAGDDNDTVCGNEGRRIFFERTANGPLGTITWQFTPDSPGWDIVDCDGTGDGTGVVRVDEHIEGVVVVRVHGAKSDSLTLICDDVIDEGADDLCIVDGSVNLLNKSKEFTKIMTNVFDDEYEEVLWTLSTGTGFRIAEVRFYEFGS